MTKTLTKTLIAALIAATTLVAVGPPAGADPAPAVTVTPSTDLLDGHVVDVTATGLEPGDDYAIAQCPVTGSCQLVVSIGDGRQYIPPHSSLSRADSGGTIDVRLQLDRDTCVPDGCNVDVIPVESVDPIVPVASTPLAFAASGSYQWPEAELTATFPSTVIDGRTVTVDVSGMSPWHLISPNFGSVASIDVCRDDDELTGADCVRGIDFAAPRFDYVELGGDDVAGRGTAVLQRHLPGGWDCAVDGCLLVVTQGGNDVVVGNPRTQAVPIPFSPEWAPYASAGAFIDQAITGVLGRKPTTAGRARLEAGLPDRSITGVQALIEAAASSKHDATVGEVVRLYRAYFGRPVETAGLTYWVGRLRAGMTPLAMARAFGASQEFRTRYGTVAGAASVRLTYLTVLGREPSPNELEYWRQRFAAGLTEADLVYSFARSPENRSRTNRAVWATIILWRLTGNAPTADHLARGPERVAADALAAVHP
jgi:hypothetical protein